MVRFVTAIGAFMQNSVRTSWTSRPFCSMAFFPFLGRLPGETPTSARGLRICLGFLFRNRRGLGLSGSFRRGGAGSWDPGLWLECPTWKCWTSRSLSAACTLAPHQKHDPPEVDWLWAPFSFPSAHEDGALKEPSLSLHLSWAKRAVTWTYLWEYKIL